jgi:hypothetical protein
MVICQNGFSPIPHGGILRIGSFDLGMIGFANDNTGMRRLQRHFA